MRRNRNFPHKLHHIPIMSMWIHIGHTHESRVEQEVGTYRGYVCMKVIIDWRLHLPLTVYIHIYSPNVLVPTGPYPIRAPFDISVAYIFPPLALLNSLVNPANCRWGPIIKLNVFDLLCGEVSGSISRYFHCLLAVYLFILLSCCVQCTMYRYSM